jgi:hypothetical protein
MNGWARLVCEVQKNPIRSAKQQIDPIQDRPLQEHGVLQSAAGEGLRQPDQTSLDHPIHIKEDRYIK